MNVALIPTPPVTIISMSSGDIAAKTFSDSIIPSSLRFADMRDTACEGNQDKGVFDSVYKAS